MQQAADRGRIILNAMGKLLEKRGFPNWIQQGDIVQLPGPGVALEVMIPTALSLWPVGMVARAAFDEYAAQGSVWLGTSVWEPADPKRPLLGCGLMQESHSAWWTIDWMQQNGELGMLTARLSWHRDPQKLAERLDRFVTVMEHEPAGQRAASFLRNHVNELYAIAQKRRLCVSNLATS